MCMSVCMLECAFDNHAASLLARSRQLHGEVGSFSERYEWILPTAGLSLPELLHQQ